MAVAVGDGVPLLMVVAVLRQVDFTHPHSQEAEGRRRIQGILCATVMAAVWVVAGTGHVLWKVKPLLQFGLQAHSHLHKVRPRLH